MPARLRVPSAAPKDATETVTAHVNPLIRSLRTPRHALAIALVVLAQAAIGLYIGLPGQLSYDSIVQLYEGTTGRFISHNPPLMSLLLGALDRLGSGPVGFVLLSQLLLSTSTWLALSREDHASTGRWVLAAILMLNPVVLCYVGIVWKDVLLAHTVLLAYFLIARLRERGVPLTLSLSVLILLLLCVIVGTRQQGVLFAVPAAIWAATLLRGSRRACALVALAFVAIPLASDRLVHAYARHLRTDSQVDAIATSLKYLALFDIAGIMANGGSLPSSTPPVVAKDLQRVARGYTPYRVDTLPGPGPEWAALSAEEVTRLSLRTIGANREAYLKHRGQHFLTVLGLADMRRCLPLWSGIAGPVRASPLEQDLNTLLGLPLGPHPVSAKVNAFGWAMANTPLFMHLAYAALLVVIAVGLYRRGEDVLLTLAVCSLVFLASYAILGLACDFRYGYTLTVATMLLAARWILSPPADDGKPN